MKFVSIALLCLSLAGCASADYASVGSDANDGARASMANKAFPHHDRAKGYSLGGS